jgi:inner membrane protein
VPSPIGHVLSGLAAGWLVAGRSPAAAREPQAGSSPRVHALDRDAVLYALLGAAPDVDLLFDAHSTYTHSIGAVAVTALAALLWTRGRQVRRALACAAALASHVLLDWLGSDTTPPLGVMALWPFTHEFYQSPFFVFMAISRRWWLPGFYTQNGLAAVRELVILTPIVALIGALRARFARLNDFGTGP